MQFVLLVVQIIIAVLLICVILFQKTAQDGGGLMGGGNTMGGLFTARGSANALTKVTKFLAIAFIANSLLLSYIASSMHQSKSLLDTITTAPTVPSAAVPVPATEPAAPQVPLAK